MSDLKKIAAELEVLVDAHTLAEVLEALVDVCSGKAEHIQSNWQDAELAKVWNKAGVNIARACQKVETLEI